MSARISPFFTLCCLCALELAGALSFGQEGTDVKPDNKPLPSEKKMATDVPEGHPPIIIEKPQKEEKITAESVQKMLKKISSTDYELNGIQIDLKAQEVRLPCVIKIIKGPLEYVLTKDTGSAHEALFVTTNNPFEVQIAMLLMGFKPCETYFKRAGIEDYPQSVENPKIEPGSRFQLLVEYTDKEKGEKKRVPAEDWVKNLTTDKPLTPEDWVFTGSFFDPNGNLSAMASGNMISLYQDPVALANNPRKGNEQDDNWEPMPNLPAENTPVTIVFKKSIPPQK